MNLPKRDELSLRTVLAFPKASRMGFDRSTRSMTPAFDVASAPRPTTVRYRMTILVVSVFPAPDSPEMRIDCDASAAPLPAVIAAAMSRYAASAVV